MLTVIQILCGILYANGIEYLWHKCVMHGRPSVFQRRHAEHHRLVSAGAEHTDNALALTWPVAALYAIHIPILLWLHLSAALWAITGYLIALEITHRAQHRWPNLWLIGAWHAAHHEFPLARYNTFCGIWDRILGTHK